MAVPQISESHLETYIKRMDLSLKDKLFFSDKLPKNLIFLDIGCGTGFLLKGLSLERKSDFFIGFDESDQILEGAEDLNIPNSFFSSDFYEAIERTFKIQEETNNPIVLILSSVIHELQSYLSFKERHVFWDELMGIGAKYVVIRDMGLCNDDAIKHTDPRLAGLVTKICEADEKLKPALNQFKRKYGGIYRLENFVHFLLKYHYLDNWEREIDEDYMTSPDNIMDDLEEYGYKQEFYKEYTLPFIQDKVKQDFRFILPYKTHYQLIASLTKENE